MLWLRLMLLSLVLPAAWWAGTRAGVPVPGSPLERMIRDAPGLDPAVARHLVLDDDRTWLTFARSLGVRGLSDAYQVIVTRLDGSTPAQFQRSHRDLHRALRRISLGLAEGFGFDMPLRCVDQLLSQPLGARYAIHRLSHRHAQIQVASGRPLAERRRELERVTSALASLGAAPWALRTEHSLAGYDLEQGDAGAHRRRLHRVLALARATDDAYIECQILGELGSTHWSAGELDSTRLRYDEALAIARRHQFLDQAARILRFEAALHVDEGRLALAAERLGEALELCEQPGAGSARLRMQVEHAAFMTRLGCWDLADRALRRMPPLFRGYALSGQESDVNRQRFESERLQARLAFELGDPGEGDRRMQRVLQGIPHGFERMAYARVFDEWSRGLQGSGWYPRALTICERGVAHCDTAHVPEYEWPLRLRRAVLLERLGRVSDARRELAGVRPQIALPQTRDERLAREAELLEIRLLGHEGRAGAARAALAACQRRFERGLGVRECGIQNYLELDDAHALRMAWHELAGWTAIDGYRFENRWRALSAELGSGRRAGGRTPSARGGFPPPAPLPLPGQVHVVYLFRGDALLRWTARAGGVVLDTLDLSAARALAQVRLALSAIQREAPPAADWLGPTARAALEPLATVLLPRDLLAGTTGIATVFVSTDGPLLALPFEALPLPAPDGRPLAAVADVAYLHGERPRGARAAGPAVVVANPAIPAALRRRHAGAVALAGATTDVGAARSRWPDALVLRGGEATKPRVLAAWSRAPVIYLAAHHIRDPDAPFLGFVAMAAPPGAAAADALLEIADVHALDLSGCRLVVLAACASGAPYRLAMRPGPSLGGAFLDSGAGAVVESLWEVGDTETGEFMRRLLARRPGETEPAALGRARREFMCTPAGRAPRAWAAWSVHLGRMRLAPPADADAPSLALAAADR